MLEGNNDQRPEQDTNSCCKRAGIKPEITLPFAGFKG